MVPWAHPSLHHIGISIGSAVFAPSLSLQTDRPHYSVSSNKLHLASAAMQPNN